MYFSGIKIYLLLWDEVLLIDIENELDFQKFEKKVTHNSKKPNEPYTYKTVILSFVQPHHVWYHFAAIDSPFRNFKWKIIKISKFWGPRTIWKRGPKFNIFDGPQDPKFWYFYNFLFEILKEGLNSCKMIPNTRGLDKIKNNRFIGILIRYIFS